MNDSLGDRMKGYENENRHYLPAHSYTIIRLDIRAGHSYLRNEKKPFCEKFGADMDEVTEFLMSQVDHVKLAYVQSDEISLLLTDFAKPTTQAWFGGNLNKIVSLSAAAATFKLNELRPGRMVLFDSRAFTVPNEYEAANYFVWRQQDALRNSVSMRAQAKFSHKELHGKNTPAMLEMLSQTDEVAWPQWVSHGRVGFREGMLDGSTQKFVATAPKFFAQPNSWLMYHIPVKETVSL